MLTTSILAEAGIVGFDPAQAVWILVIFVILVIVLYKTAWKNVLAGLKAREDSIRKDIADAEAARIKSEASMRQYDERLASAEQKVRDLLSQATIDAEKIATGIKMRSQQEAEEAKDRATKEIETAKQLALREIYEQTAELATAVAEKILRRNLNPDDQRDLVAQSLEQLHAVGSN